MKRPMLLFGTVTLLSAVLFLCFGKTAAVCCAAAGVSVLFLLLLLRKKLNNRIFIPFVSFALLICGLSFLLFQQKNVESVKDFSFGEHSLIAFVSGVLDKTEDFTVYTLKTKEIDGEKSSHKVMFTDYGNKFKISLYDTVSFKNTQFITSENIHNSYLGERIFLCIQSFDGCDILFRQKEDIIFYVLKFKEKCIENIKFYLPGNEAGVLSGMLFGDKSLLDNKVYSSFKTSGVSHLLAVSGLHTSLWCGVLYAILKLLRIKEKTAGIISLIFLFLLCVVSGFSPSVLRASFMMSLILIAPFFKRQPDTVNSLGFAVTVIILFNPYILYSAGFNLSVTAASGVILSGIFGRLGGTYSKNSGKFIGRLAEYIKSTFTASVFATVFTLPFCAYYFGSCSVIAPVTNIFCIKLGFVSMVSGLFCVLLSFMPFGIGSLLSQYIFKIPQILLWLLIKIISFFAKIPYACVPVGTVTVICVFAVAVLFTVVYLLLKNKPVKTAVKSVCYIVLSILFLCSYFTSFPQMSFNREVSVVSDRGTPLIAVRNGVAISLIGVPYNLSGYRSITEFLPFTVEQDFTNLVITGDYNKNSKLSEIFENYKPKEVYSPIWCYENFINSEFSEKVNFRENTGEIKSGKGIMLQCIDNYLEKYVIIKNSGKKFVFSVSGYNENNATDYLDGNPELVVIGKYETAEFKRYCKTLVVCTDGNLNKITENKLNMYCTRLVVLKDGNAKTFSLNGVSNFGDFR